MNALTAANLNKAIIYSKVEESRKYDECMYILALGIFQRESTISASMLRQELHIEYEYSLKLMEKVKIDYIFAKANKERAHEST